MNEQELRALTAPEKGNWIHYGMGKPGLGLRITANDARAWIFNYTSPSGKRRRATLGRYPNLSLAQAQTKADECLARLVEGVLVRENGAERREKLDPLEEKRRERSKAQSATREMTVKELAEIWWERHALTNKKLASQQADRVNLDKWILPTFGRKRLTEVIRADIETLMVRMRGVPIQANRMVALLSTLMTYAIDHEWIERNPVKGVKHYDEQPRIVSVTRAELDRLYQAIQESEHTQAARAVKLLIWTGARRDEVLKAHWGEFDLDRGLWTREAVRNKQGTPTVTPLNALALKLLREMETTKGDERRLFKGVSLRWFWSRVTAKAGRPDLRVHDLRHVYATVMLEGGAPLDSIAALLGHSNTVMTKLYANRSTESLKQIVSTAGALLAPRLPARERAETKRPQRVRRAS